MKLSSALTLSALALCLAACSGDADAGRAEDPAGRSDPGAMPTAPVVPDGEVTTRYAATVMDTGRPELCLGAVAESYPPQCGGPALEGWDWADHEGHYDQQGDVRWGEFVVTGAWDGTTFTATSARARDEAALPGPEPEPSGPPQPPSAAELSRIAEEVRDLGGAQGSYAADTYVLVDVTYDDGSLQEWVDATYGDDVVVVSAALVDS